MFKNGNIAQAGEYRVASELMLRGFDVSFTSRFSDADLIVGNGIRVQVKTSNPTKAFPHNYHFCFKHWSNKIPHDLDKVQFVILWPVYQDIFYIAPVDVVKGHWSASITINKHNRGPRGIDWDKYKDAWDLLKGKGR